MLDVYISSTQESTDAFLIQFLREHFLKEEALFYNARLRLEQSAYYPEEDLQYIQDHLQTLSASTTVSHGITFYYQLLADLLAGLEVEVDVDHPSQAIAISLRCMRNVIHALAENMPYFTEHFSQFMLSISRIFDEIKCLLTYRPQYCFADLQTHLSQFIEHTHRRKPTHVSIASSGMHAISQGITCILNDIKRRKSHRGKSHYHHSIMVESGYYYEIETVLEHMLPFRREKGEGERDTTRLYLAVDTAPNGSQHVQYTQSPATDDATHHFLDFMILSAVDNISTSHPGHHSHDIIGLINSQFRLREEIQSKDPLYVLIDTTMENIRYIYTPLLLLKFEKYIQTGHLLILTTHSMNKQLQLGLDSMFCGVTAIHYQPAAFPVIKDYYDHVCMTDWLETDTTFQVVTHMLTHAGQAFARYTKLIEENTRFVYEQVVPCTLFDTNLSPFVSIDLPYTTDIYHNPWNFLTIRINNALYTSHRQLIEDRIIQRLETLGVNDRDGYGFAETSYITISTNLIRISLGLLVSEAQSRTLVESVCQVLEAINQRQCCYPLYLAAAEGRLDRVNELLQEDSKTRPEGGLPGPLMRLGPQMATPLLLAVEGRHVEVVRVLLQQQDPLFSTARMGRQMTPLIAAASKGYCEIVELLVGYCESAPEKAQAQIIPRMARDRTQLAVVFQAEIQKQTPNPDILAACLLAGIDYSSHTTQLETMRVTNPMMDKTLNTLKTKQDHTQSALMTQSFLAQTTNVHSEHNLPEEKTRNGIFSTNAI
ncbi:MAG: hypothetical protein A3J38_00895 [Gammaproteobacteria bacterium RIFCSPHIGHO2_12_FULL_45_9]|nr:MAG: hypothetical protein A3J38_00895 [Gammaproteobacteria bacterium RIFCSPHIGHO2_12_FULL_45_9]